MFCLFSDICVLAEVQGWSVYSVCTSVTCLYRRFLWLCILKSKTSGPLTTSPWTLTLHNPHRGVNICVVPTAIPQPKWARDQLQMVRRNTKITFIYTLRCWINLFLSFGFILHCVVIQMLTIEKRCLISTWPAMACFLTCDRVTER